MMHLLGIDIGTTHCKAGLFDADGAAIAIAHRATPTRQHSDGSAFYDPDELWATVAKTIREATQQTSPHEIAAIGVASMAETGLLIDRRTGNARTPFVPWFDTQAAPYAEQIEKESDRFERFCATGQYPSFKSPLAKLLWLRNQQHDITDLACWLSAADYIVYRLTGQIATDFTLATRTYAFRIDRKDWDDDWLDRWGLSANLFPEAALSGTVRGKVTVDQGNLLGVAAGTPVAVAGHDHVCGALAVDAIEPGSVFDSMGTAETLIGAVDDRPLARREYQSGLGYGCHVAPGRLYWMGGLSVSGGSIEWLRALLGDPPLPYETFMQLVEAAGSEPTGIVYFPYLLGSGTPHPDPHARGVFFGLRAGHGRAQIAKAVLEGTAFELEFMRRAAEHGTDTPITTIVVAGGGTRNRHWMQIKADVSGCVLSAPHIAEATTLGAAILAGIGCGLYKDIAATSQSIRQQQSDTYVPDSRRHEIYCQLYEHVYLPLQQPLREASRRLVQFGAK